jgi:hypothetical protein
MAEKFLELTSLTYTAKELVIKVKNTSGASLDKRLVIDFSPPGYLVDNRINAAAIAAAKSDDSAGAESLAGIVTGPQGWSVWARREPSDSSLFIVFINDMDQNGNNLPAPVKFPAGSEFTVTIPLDPTATRGHIDLLYSYQREQEDSFYGKIELKPDQTTFTPVVRLFTRHKNPTMVKPGEKVDVSWEIQDGVSAVLRGPLPGGNPEIKLETKAGADFKLSEGSVDVYVMSTTIYVLEAVVKREGHDNVQVVRMLTLDTSNHKYLYVSLYPNDILPHGLLEINWAAWGVREVTINVTTLNNRHTTRTIPLTQQTKGRSYEGTGVMRVSASKTGEKVVLSAESMEPESKDASVVSWVPLLKSDLKDPLAMALLAPKLAVLTAEGLFIFTVGESDPSTQLDKLAFRKTSTETPKQWLSLTGVEKEKKKMFVVLRRTNQDDLEVAPYTLDGTPEDIAPLNLPASVRPLVTGQGTIYDCVGFRGRVYVVVEAGFPDAKLRGAFSVAFDNNTKKSDYRPEPLLEPLAGYRLVTFDGSLYALSRASGRMFRFDLTTSGTLEEPRAAASAIKEDSPLKESMIRKGVFVPLTKTLAVLSPTSVPSVKSLDRFGLHNVLGYEAESTASPNSPQDLVYNPQKNYWARCGHDINVEQLAVTAYRPTGSRRLWLIQPNGETHTLAVGSESLFVHDYVSSVPTAALPPYLDKKREFTITNNTRMNFVPMGEKYHNAGLTGFAPTGPAELLSPLPEKLPSGGSATFQFRYNEADPAPTRLRFLVERPAGVKHDYFVEVTFLGRDLTAAISVFKRIAEDQGGLSVAEIPGTTVNNPTNKPIVLPAPQLLVEGIRLRVQNATTYQLWREPNGGAWPGELVIRSNTPAFSIYAHGAGHLHVNVDFSLPYGIEIASAGVPQRKSISIDESRSSGLRAEVLQEVPNVGVEIRINYVGKSDIKGVYIGDGAASGDALYIPVSTPADQRRTQILKINPENFAVIETTHTILYSALGRFAMPNSIAVTKEGMLALFDNEVWLMDTSMRIQTKFPYLNSTISAFTAHSDGDWCIIETNPSAGLGAMFSNYTYHFQLLRGRIGKNFRQELDFHQLSQVGLDEVRAFNHQPFIPGAPNWVPRSTSPIALSPSLETPRGERVREAAICISGGVFVVGNNAQGIRSLALQSARQEEAVVFGSKGVEIYCAHSQADNEGLRISRVDNKGWKQTHTLSLPRGEGVANLTTDTRQRRPLDRDKVSRSASMVLHAQGEWLFVSHGRSVFKIEAATLTLRDTYKVDLPCRLFHVGWGKPTPDSHPLYGAPTSGTLLYALGASYTGDGSPVNENQYKTHLYKIAIRD